MPRFVGCGVGPVERVPVGQCHVAGPQSVVGSQHTKAVGDGVAPFQSDQGRDLAVSEDPLYVIGGLGQGKGLGVGVDHLPGNVDLFQLHPYKLVRLQVGGYVDRPELPSHHALP